MSNELDQYKTWIIFGVNYTNNLVYIAPIAIGCYDYLNLWISIAFEWDVV